MAGRDVGEVESSGNPHLSSTVSPWRFSSLVKGKGTIGVMWMGSPLARTV